MLLIPHRCLDEIGYISTQVPHLFRLESSWIELFDARRVRCGLFPSAYFSRYNGSGLLWTDLPGAVLAMQGFIGID